MMAAAELTGRTCLGLELDPKFVDVILMRWQKLSGQEATLDGSGGQTLDQIKHSRQMVAGEASH